jgi:hypothetical protein
VIGACRPARLLCLLPLLLLSGRSEGVAPPPLDGKAEEAVRKLVTARLSSWTFPFWFGSTISLDNKTTVEQVRSWQKTRAPEFGREAPVGAVNNLGARAVPALHRALVSLPAEHPAAERLAHLLREHGTRESIPVLIELLARAEVEGQLGDVSLSGIRTPKDSPRVTAAATTAALWELTGHERCLNSGAWRSWWRAVADDFVPVRDRVGRRVERRTVAGVVRRLTAGDPFQQDRLIVLGPSAVPHILAEMPAAPEWARYELAIALDELGAADQLPVEARRDYFVRRLRNEKWNRNNPTWEKLMKRAGDSQRFADFCRTMIEVDRSFPKAMHDAPMWGEMKSGNLITNVLQRRIAADIDDAVPVLTKALEDRNAAVRRVAIEIAGRIGMDTRHVPEGLIRALHRLWHSEKDDWLRDEAAVSFARFATVFVADALVAGLSSREAGIQGDAASCVDFNALCDVRKNAGARAGMIALLSQGCDRAHRRAAWSLAHTLPEEVLQRSAQLSKDPLADVREACLIAMQMNPQPEHLPLLRKLMADPVESVRDRAFSHLGNPMYRAALPDVVPRLRDRKDAGRAVWCIVGMGGPQAVRALIVELERGNDVSGTVFHGLRRLTGKNYEKREDWLRWYRSTQPVT